MEGHGTVQPAGQDIVLGNARPSTNGRSAPKNHVTLKSVPGQLSFSAGFDCTRNSRPICVQIVIRMGGVPRGIRRGLPAGDHQQPACREAATVAAVVSEHRRNGGSGRVRLRRGLCRDGLLIRPYGNPPHVDAGPGNAVSGIARRLDRRHCPARFRVHDVKERQRFAAPRSWHERVGTVARGNGHNCAPGECSEAPSRRKRCASLGPNMATDLPGSPMSRVGARPTDRNWRRRCIWRRSPARRW